jgi:FMN phosphatase YigB (HAD superfamily)
MVARMAEAILFDYGHTLVNFITNERALLAAYDDVAALLMRHVAGEVPPASHLLEHISQRIAQRIEDSYLRQELAELDMLREFQEAFAGIDLHLPPDLVREVAVMEHRALAAETFLPHVAPAACGGVPARPGLEH